MIDSRIRLGYAERLLISLAVGRFGVTTGRLLLPPLLPALIAEFGISLATAGVMLTVLQGANALMLYPSGQLSDELSRATLIVPGLVALVLGAVLIGATPTYLGLVAGVALFGFGGGLYAIPSRALVSDHYVNRRGWALGVLAAGFNIGGVLASGVATLALAVATWRTPFFGLGGVLAFGTLLFVYWNSEPIVIEPPTIEIRETLRRLLTTAQLRRPLIAFTLFYFATHSLLNFFPAYLQSSKGFSPGLASLGFALIFAIGLPVKVLAGWLSDRVSRQVIATGGLVLAAGALTGIIFARSSALVLLGLAVFAVGHQAQFPLVDAILMDAAPETKMGADLGAARTVFFGVGSLGPAYVGFVALVYGYLAAFAGLLACLLVAAVVLLRFPHSS